MESALLVRTAPPPTHTHPRPRGHPQSLAECSLGAEQPARAAEGAEKMKGARALREPTAWPPPVLRVGDL